MLKLRGLGAALAIVLTVAALPLAVSSPALAASAGCGSLCDGKNPQTFIFWDENEVPRVCADSAFTVYTVSGGSSGSAELRYSPRCRTAWARGGEWVKVESFRADGSFRSTSESAHFTYTSMVNDAGLLARACVFVFFGDWVCGSKY